MKQSFQQQSEPSGLVARPIVSREEVVNFPDGPEVTNYQDQDVYLLYLCSCSFDIFVTVMSVKMFYTREKDATFNMLTIQRLAGPHQTARLSALKKNAA